MDSFGAQSERAGERRYSRSDDTIMTIASREIVNTFLNAGGKNCSRAESSRGEKRNYGGKERVFTRSSRVPSSPFPLPPPPNCAPTMGMLLRTVESVLYVLVRDSIGGETRELGLLLRSGKEIKMRDERLSPLLSLSLRESFVEINDR